jgi:hypothetical protein
VKSPTLLLALLLQAPPSGDAEIRGGGIVIRTTTRLAGAIDSLSWNGREFIDSFDHGRQLQSACSFGDGGAGFAAETYNPTEAGSRDDGRGPTSTSVLLSLAARENVLETRTQMAFWLRPGETSEGKPARNTGALSGHIVSKKVTIGVQDLPRVIEYQVRFTIPKEERHPFAQFEALTGYMPAEFSTFLVFDRETGKTSPLTDGPGEQKLPIVFSTESGSHAMAIWSPLVEASYGRWRFKAEKVVKWNVVFRYLARDVVPAETFAYTQFVVVGTRDDVTRALGKLAPAK